MIAGRLLRIKQLKHKNMEEGMGVGGRVSSMEERGGGGKCGRWNPTAEQVEVLTGLFRAGLRTPTTDQIQSISAELSMYGQIESKNVFYWFQNHKARERHKRRRVSASTPPHLHSTKLPHHGHLHRHHPHPHHTFPPHFSPPPPPPLPPSTCISQESPLSNESSKRVIQTLQLFPLSSYNEPPTELGNLTKECKESACDSFSYPFTFGKEIQHQPLDLCLTFL